MNNLFKKSILLAGIMLLLPTSMFCIKSFKDLEPEDFPKVMNFISQDGKFKSQDFNGDISFNNYLYWLGLCNLNDKDFSRAYASFIFSVSFAYTIKSDKLVHCELATANTLLLLHSMVTGNRNAQDVQVRFYNEARENNLEEGMRGLAITYSLNKEHAKADEILTKIMAMPLTRRRAHVLIFCSLVLNEPKYFINVINEMNNREIIYDPLLVNNIAVGYTKFRNSGIKDADKQAMDLWNTIDDNITTERYEKAFKSIYVFSVPVHGKTNVLDLPRAERRLIARLHIDVVGWANPAIDPLPDKYEKLLE